MKAIIIIFLLMTFSSLNAYNKQQKLPDTIKASMVAIRKDPIFLEYINCKKKLLYGMAYNEWNISIENIHALSQDSTSIKNSKDLYNLYKRYFLDPKFTYLIEKVSNLSKEIKNKYEVHKFKSLWKELNQAEYSKIVINEARIAFVWRISNQAGKADSCVKYMALCNKSWETLKQNSLRQLWEKIGEFCRFPTQESGRADFLALKGVMDCRLISYRHFLEKMNIAANNHEKCSKRSNCR